MTAASEVTGTSLRLTDQRTGESFDMSARAVINATGVWAGEIDPTFKLRPSRGTHLVFDAVGPRQSHCGADDSDTRRAQPLRVRHARTAGPGVPRADRRGGPRADSRRATTDSEEIASCSTSSTPRWVSRWESADVIGAYAGLRPLIDTGAGRTADVSRDHAVVESPSGVISVVGGKLTEYRHMAQDVLDRAIEVRGLEAGECRTRNLPLVGAPATGGRPWRRWAGLPESLVAALRGRGGLT